MADAQRGMGLARRREGFFDAEVKLQAAALEPHSTALGRSARLRDLLESKKAGIERTCPVFLASRNGDLNVVQSEHVVHWITPDIRSMAARERCAAPPGERVDECVSPRRWRQSTRACRGGERAVLHPDAPVGLWGTT